MSLALSTLVIVLFALLPGAIFERTLFSGKVSRIRAKTPTLVDITLAAGSSVIIHLIALSSIPLLARRNLAISVDYDLFSHLIAGEFESELIQGTEHQVDYLGRLATNLEHNRLWISGYILLACSIALVAGHIVQYAVLRSTKLYGFLPFANPWFKRMFFPGGQPISVCEAFVLTEATYARGRLLYRGEVDDFALDEQGDLGELTLRKPQRGLLRDDSGEHSGSGFGAELRAFLLLLLNRKSEVEAAQPVAPDPKSWCPLPEPAFIIPGKQINNISLTHHRFFRRQATFIEEDIRFPAGQDELEVSLLPSCHVARRILKLTRPQISIAAARAIETRVSKRKPWLVTVGVTEEVVKDFTVRVKVVRMGLQDSRVENTANLLVLLEQLVSTGLWWALSVYLRSMAKKYSAETNFTPASRSLVGIAAGSELDEEDFRKHQGQKHR